MSPQRGESMLWALLRRNPLDAPNGEWLELEVECCDAISQSGEFPEAWYTDIMVAIGDVAVMRREDAYHVLRLLHTNWDDLSPNQRFEAVSRLSKVELDQWSRMAIFLLVELLVENAKPEVVMPWLRSHSTHGRPEIRAYSMYAAASLIRMENATPHRDELLRMLEIGAQSADEVVRLEAKRGMAP